MVNDRALRHGTDGCEGILPGLLQKQVSWLVEEEATDQVRIGILGWGSLLWEGGAEFDRWREAWRYDGPTLSIEFSRISKRRLGALTLVIDPEHGVPTVVAWCVSKRATLNNAVWDLRSREDTTVKNIGQLLVSPKAETPASSGTEDPLVLWARSNQLEAVVWTALTSNFERKRKEPFSVTAVVAYVKTLNPEGKAKAAEYIWRAPDFVRTPVRSAIQVEPWFTTS